MTVLVICVAMVVLFLKCVLGTKDRVTEFEGGHPSKKKQTDSVASPLEIVKSLLTNKY